MKKFLIILSYVSVAVVSGFVSVIGYNALLKSKVIHDYQQLELREQQLKLEYKKKQMEIEIEQANNTLKERANDVAHRKAIEDLRQKERENEIANRKTSQSFTQ